MSYLTTVIWNLNRIFISIFSRFHNFWFSCRNIFGSKQIFSFFCSFSWISWFLIWYLSDVSAQELLNHPRIVPHQIDLNHMDDAILALFHGTICSLPISSRSIPDMQRDEYAYQLHRYASNYTKTALHSAKIQIIYQSSILQNMLICSNLIMLTSIFLYFSKFDTFHKI